MMLYTLICFGIATAVAAASAIYAAIEYVRAKDDPEKRQLARKVIERSAILATIAATILLIHINNA